MDQNLAYLHEVLSNYTEENASINRIDDRMTANHYVSEEMFVRDLSEEEVYTLNNVLKKELDHAKESGDEERVAQLNAVYELLF